MKHIEIRNNAYTYLPCDLLVVSERPHGESKLFRAQYVALLEDEEHDIDHGHCYVSLHPNIEIIPDVECKAFPYGKHKGVIKELVELLYPYNSERLSDEEFDELVYKIAEQWQSVEGDRKEDCHVTIALEIRATIEELEEQLFNNQLKEE